MNIFLRILGSALVYTVLAQILFVVVNLLSYTLLNDVQYAASLSGMGQSLLTGFPSQEFLLWSSLGYFLFGLLFSGLYRFLGLPRQCGWFKKGLIAGVFAALIVGIGSYFNEALLWYLSPSLFAVWFAGSVVTMILGGVLVALINRK